MTQTPSKRTNTNGEDIHLFLFIHGLWGSPNHMSTIEQIVKESINSLSSERVATLKPSSFRFWKTYDGIERCGENTIADLFYEIETLKLENKFHVKKLSIVGYSFGGLVARFVVGSLYELGFFNEVRPIFFCTFATPHVGVYFCRDSFFDRIANSLGKRLFGVTGYQLFLADSENLLVEMAKPESRFTSGISLFQKRILLANIKYDRSVPFFTSFITDTSPFESLKSIKIEYFEGLPPSQINDVTVWPKFVDLRRTFAINESNVKHRNIQEATSILRSNVVIRYTLLLFAAILLFPLYLPFIVCLSFYVSCYSIVKVKLTEGPDIIAHWTSVRSSVFHGGPIQPEHAHKGNVKRLERESVSNKESLKGDTSSMAKIAMERVLVAEEKFFSSSVEAPDRSKQTKEELTYNTKDSAKFSHKLEDFGEDRDMPEPASLDSIVHETPRENTLENSEEKLPFAKVFGRGPFAKIPVAKYDEAIRMHSDKLHWNKDERIPIFEEKYRLRLSRSQSEIVKNLNDLDWIKIAVFHDSFNAHDSIVARKGGLKNPKGACTLYLWGSILRTHLLSNEAPE